MTSNEFFTKLDSEILPKPWRKDQRPVKHQIIDFAAEKGFTLSGDVRIATDGWVNGLVRVDFPAGWTFNDKTFTICDLSVKDQGWAWIFLNMVLTDIVAANERATN